MTAFLLSWRLIGLGILALGLGQRLNVLMTIGSVLIASPLVVGMVTFFLLGC